MESIIALAERMQSPFAFAVLAIIGGITIMVCIRATYRSVERQKQMDFQREVDLRKMDGPKQITQNRARED